MLVAYSVHTIGPQHASRLVYTLLDPSMLVASSVHTIGPQHASRLQCTHYWTPAC